MALADLLISSAVVNPALKRLCVFGSLQVYYIFIFLSIYNMWIFSFSDGFLLFFLLISVDLIGLVEKMVFAVNFLLTNRKFSCIICRKDFYGGYL